MAVKNALVGIVFQCSGTCNSGNSQWQLKMRWLEQCFSFSVVANVLVMIIFV